jgi:PAS domain S-box-containing protein
MRRALRETQEQFRLFMDGTEDAICMLDADGRITQCNRAVTQMIGYEEEEILGRPFACFFADEDTQAGKPEQVLQTAIAKERFVQAEGWRVRKDGSRFWASATITALRDATGTLRGFSEVARDLTERRSLEEQLRQAQRMESVGRLAGGVAHDFNNLLAAIQGSSELLLDRFPDGDRSRRAAERIHKAAERGAALTRQLLAFSRRQVFKPRILELNGIVTELRDLVARLLGEDIEFELGLEARLRRVEADPTHIDQILMNLVVNARDAMPDGGHLVILTANVDLEEAEAKLLELQAGRYVELAIRDSGHGMDGETLSKMFEPFFTTKEPGKGTGLGLSTVFGLVKQNGGGIGAESELDRGTIVRIYLPSAEERISRAGAESRPDPRTERGSETILIVEDNQLLREHACEILGASGYSILSANDPETALRLSEEHQGQIDLVLSDVVMPQMNGFELAAQLRQRYPQMRILLMSGYSQTELADREALDRRVPLIQKPFSNRDLMDRVREMLER